MPTIKSVRAIPLVAPLEETFGSARGWIRQRQHVLVRVELDDGTQGYGECWGPVAGTREAIDALIGPSLVGRDPLETTVIWDELTYRLRWAYHGFVPYSAVSGVDIALWDVKGKLLGEPLYRLLGGQAVEGVRVYATGHYFAPDRTPEEVIRLIVEEAVDNVERGFTAVKLKVGMTRLLGCDLRYDLELIGSVREAVGPDVAVMIDASCALSYAEALRVAAVAAEHDVLWFEEPLDPDDLRGYERLAAASRVPLAAGESWTSVQPFAEALRRGAVAFVQPDVCVAGGITPVTRVAALARAANVELAPHVWGTPICLAASLHLLCAEPRLSWLELDTTPDPIRDELLREPIDVSPRSGVAVPEAPGLGIEIDQATLEHYEQA